MIMKKEKGITLIALVITIVVLLILAAVTINLTLGERGIFNIAQKAAKNYTDAAEKEASNLDDFESEVDKIIRDTTVAWKDMTAANYGDYVNYEDGLDLGSSTYGHATDWRVFYKDKDGYVYLISSYYLPYAQLPSGPNLQPANGKPYSSYWTLNSVPSEYEEVKQETYDRYKMNFKYNGSPNNGYDNMKFVSELMNISAWSKFVNSKYAEDAIGSPTLEMWVDSWNETGNMKIYYDNTNSYGYYEGTSSKPTSIDVGDILTTNTLYFPVNNSTCSDTNGYSYWLASPAAKNNIAIACIGCSGHVSYNKFTENWYSIRPIVRLKNTVNAEKVNGIWELK